MATGYVTSTLHAATDGSGNGHVEVRFADAPHAAPAAGEVVVAVHAASVNPSDIGQLYVGADRARGVMRETDEGLVYSAPIAPERLRHLQGRWGQQLACGNEGAGIVVDAGTDPQAQALLGKRAAFLGDLSPAQHEALKARIQAGLLMTFASRYSRQLRLEDLCRPEVAAKFSGLRTGRKAVLQVA